MQENAVLPTGQAAEGGPPTSNALACLLRDMAAFIVYVLLSFSSFPVPISDWSRAYVGYGDPLGFLWFLHWWPWAIAHGLNPFVTKFVWYPLEVNLTWLTSVPAIAILTLPITLLWNVVVSWNVVALIGPALGALAAFRLVTHVTGDFGASLLGGYIYGFSTYEIAQLTGGHEHLYLTFIPPLLVLLALLRLNNMLGRKRFIATVAALLLLQVGMATEILATMCVFGAVAWLVFIPFVGADGRRRMWRLAFEFSVAAVLMAVLALPFLYYVLHGAQSAYDPPQQYSIDLLNFFIPTPVTRLGRTVFASIATRFPGNYSESSGYLGLPLVVALVVSFVSPMRYRLPLGVLTVLFAIFSLGPSLWVNGVQTGIWLPWDIAADLPLLRDAYPARLTVFLFLVVGVVLGRWLAERRFVRIRAVRYALVLVGCLFLRAAPMPWSYLPTDPFFAPDAIARELPPADNVIVLPFYNSSYKGFKGSGPGLIWQMQSGMYFTQTGGYVERFPSAFLRYARVMNALRGDTPDPDFANDFTAFVVDSHVGDVLVGPGTPQQVLQNLTALGWPERTVGDIRVYHVPTEGESH